MHFKTSSGEILLVCGHASRQEAYGTSQQLSRLQEQINVRNLGRCPQFEYSAESSEWPGQE